MLDDLEAAVQAILDNPNTRSRDRRSAQARVSQIKAQRKKAGL
jgi:hypothetical protein